MLRINIHVDEVADKTDFDILFRTYYSQLCFYAYHLINDLEASKDITSDAFEYLWLHLEEINMTTAKTYLYSFVHSKSIDYIRHQGIQKEFIKYSELTEEDVETDFDDYDERLILIRKAMNNLTPYTRLILEECYIRQKKYKEVADELEISVNTVKKYIVKALRSIRLEFIKKEE